MKKSTIITLVVVAVVALYGVIMDRVKFALPLFFKDDGNTVQRQVSQYGA